MGKSQTSRIALTQATQLAALANDTEHARVCFRVSPRKSSGSNPSADQSIGPGPLVYIYLKTTNGLY